MHRKHGSNTIKLQQTAFGFAATFPETVRHIKPVRPTKQAVICKYMCVQSCELWQEDGWVDCYWGNVSERSVCDQCRSALRARPHITVAIGFENCWISLVSEILLSKQPNLLEYKVTWAKNNENKQKTSWWKTNVLPILLSVTKYEPLFICTLAFCFPWVVFPWI